MLLWGYGIAQRAISGFKIWFFLAKAIAGIGMVGLLYFLSSYFISMETEKCTESDLIELSTSLNKNLPQLLESNIVVTKASFEHNRFMFQYQITHKLRSELQIKIFVIRFKNELKRQVCQDKFTKKVLNNNFLLDYQYIDKNGEEIYTFNFKKSDCDDK